MLPGVTPGMRLGVRPSMRLGVNSMRVIKAGMKVVSSALAFTSALCAFRVPPRQRQTY